MKNAAIISVGNELLSGQTVDTNAAWLGQQLFAIGLPVVRMFKVPDENDAICESIQSVSNIADVLLITGGLGPTTDDLTRHALAEYLGVPLELNASLVETMQQFFRQRDRVMAPTNQIQAMLPQGTSPLPNSLGTAAGIRAESSGKLIFCLPGVPSEMREMFTSYVLPELKNLASGQVVQVRKLRCFGIGESNLAEMLGDRMTRGRNPLINCTCGHGGITLHVIATAPTLSEAAELVGRDEQDLRNLLGDLIYAQGEQTLAQVVGNLLCKSGKTLSIAESCTGGLVSKMITDVPGSSNYFLRGWVTYGNQAKIDDLGVSSSSIEQNGAVSEEICRQMAFGALQKSGSDYSIAITGIAGPAGGTPDKPVGLVYIAIGGPDGVDLSRHVFSHGRAAVRDRTALMALNMLRLKLLI